MKRWTDILSLIVLMAICLSLRLYRLEDQSLWNDESFVAAFLGAPDIGAYLRLNGLIMPDQIVAPLYYVLQYYYASIVGSSLYLLRLLPVAFSCLAVALLYFLTRKCYDSKTGLIAGLCMALSPQHIFYGQEIRSYPLIMVLILISSYALFAGIRGEGRRWWILNFIANMTLIWTHLLTVFFFPVQGLFLMAHLRRDGFRRLLSWTSVHFLGLSPLIWRLLHMPHTTNDYVSAGVDLKAILNNIWACDLVSVHTDLLPPWKINPIESLSPHLRFLLQAQAYFDAASLALFCLASAYLSFLAWRSITALWRKKETSAFPLYLLILFLLPGLTLAVLENSTGYILMNPMYSMYNTVGLYIAIGLLVATGKNRIKCSVLALGLLTLYAYQLAIFLPEVTRTDWRHAAALIQAEGGGDDLVLEIDHAAPFNNIGYYLSESAIESRSVPSFQAACDDGAAFLKQAREKSPETPPSLWVLFDEYSIVWNYSTWKYSEALPTLEKGLAAHNLITKFRRITGQYNLLLLHVRPIEGMAIPLEGGLVDPWPTVDYKKLLATLDAVTPDEQVNQERQRALRQVLPLWPPNFSVLFAVQSLELICRKQAVLAEALAREGIRRSPELGLIHFSLGAALIAQGDAPAAQKALQEAYLFHPALRTDFDSFMQALCRRDYPEARRALQRLDYGNTLFMLPLLKDLLRHCELSLAP